MNPSRQSNAIQPSAGTARKPARSDGERKAQVTGRSIRRRWLRWFVGLLVFLLILAGGCWLARKPIIAGVESVLVRRLAEQGVDVKYARRSWSLGQGLRLEEVAVRRQGGGDQPIVEMSAIAVGISVPELFKIRLLSRWCTNDATVTLHDDAGSVKFEHVTTKIVAGSGQIEASRLDFQQGPRTFALSGKILLAPDAGKTTGPAPFTLDLSPLRNVLAALDFKEGHPPFAIRGSFTLNQRGAAAVWNADLAGSGQDMEWQGVPLRQATAKGRFSAAGMELTSHLQFTSGTADLSVRRRDWNESPLLVAGSLTDGANQRDEFSAAYDSALGTLNVSDLRGKAHLLEFAGNFPILAPHLPAFVQFQKFPDLAVTNFTYSTANQPSTWSVGSIQTRSPGEVTIALGDEPIKIGALQGVVAFADNAWKIQITSGPLSWKNLASPNASIDGSMTASRLQAKLALQLTKGSVALELSSTDWNRAPLQFTGILMDSQGLTNRVTGSYQREPATLRIAKLTGKANLLEYAANFPGLAELLPEAFHFHTFPEIAVAEFTYRPGQPPTLGSLRLVSPADFTATIRGRIIAIDRVEGQVGYDGRFWKFSRVRGGLFGGQWALDGSYQNGTLRGATITASGLHMAELMTWLGDAQKSIGAATLALDYRGNIGSDFAHFTGAGSVLLENAPVVQVPLLDQTFALASALTAPLSHNGMGRLAATFAATEGVAKITHFTATSEAVKVTAEGIVDLRQRKVSGRARANLRGLFGIATGPLSRTLEMEVTGPLDNIRVRPIGLKGLLKLPTTVVPDTAKGASGVLQNGVALPLRVFDLFKAEAPDSPESKRR